jgi:hypothetical protein
MTGKIKLFTLLGDYPNTLALKRGEIHSDLVDLEFADVKVASTAFKPLVRDAKFDLGELAIVTYLQAKAYGKPYILLPAPVVARSQHHTLAYNRERGRLTPADLAGKRVGVRAFSVTTGVWVRGILQEQFGVDVDKVHWVTFEDPHVAEYRDPPTVERAPSNKNLGSKFSYRIAKRRKPPGPSSTARRSTTCSSSGPKRPAPGRTSCATCSGCSSKAAISRRGMGTRTRRKCNSGSRRTGPRSKRSSISRHARSSFPANGGSRSYSTT